MNDLQSLSTAIHALEQRPLREALMDSGLLSIKATSASGDMARNLLVKAERALRAGDDPALERYVRRAAALPFVEEGEFYPGVHWGHVRVFSTLAEFLENELWDPDEEIAWMDCVDATIGRSDRWAAAVLRDGMANLEIEADWRFANPDSPARIARITGGSGLGDPSTVAREDHAAYVRGCVQGTVALYGAFDALVARWEDGDTASL